VKYAKKRRHYKVEKLSCREMIDRMLSEGYTYDEISEAVAEAGEKIGKSSLARYHSSFEQVAENVRKTREQMKVLVDAVREGPNTDLAEVANQVMMQGLVERVAKAKSAGEFGGLSLDKAGRLVADLERSAVAREKLKLEFDRGVNSAMEKITAQLGDELRDQPELFQQLLTKLVLVSKEISA
jgi:DNA-binding transcriptional MerR regulator